MSVPSICISSLLEQKAISMALEFAGLSARAALDVVSSAWCCVLLDAAHWSRAPGRSSWRIWNPLSVCWKRQRWHYGASGWTEDKEQGHRRLWGTMDWLFQHLFRVWNVGKNPNCPSSWLAHIQCEILKACWEVQTNCFRLGLRRMKREWKETLLSNALQICFLLWYKRLILYTLRPLVAAEL